MSEPIERIFGLRERGLHCDIVRDNSLLLELKFLEDIWLQDLLDLWKEFLSVVSGLPHKQQVPNVARTELVEIEGAKGEGEGHRERGPFPLDDQRPYDEESSGNVDIVNQVTGENRVVNLCCGHGGRCCLCGGRRGQSKVPRQWEVKWESVRENIVGVGKDVLPDPQRRGFGSYRQPTGHTNGSHSQRLSVYLGVEIIYK